jgi:hypothetical protein
VEQEELFALATAPEEADRSGIWSALERWTESTRKKLEELRAEASAKGWALTIESGCWVARKDGKRTLRAPSPEPVMRRIRSRGRATPAEQLPLFAVKLRRKNS